MVNEVHTCFVFEDLEKLRRSRRKLQVHHWWRGQGCTISKLREPLERMLLGTVMGAVGVERPEDRRWQIQWQGRNKLVEWRLVTARSLRLDLVSVCQIVPQSTWILPQPGGTRFLKSKPYIFLLEVGKLFVQLENLYKGWIVTIPETTQSGTMLTIVYSDCVPSLVLQRAVPR